MQTYLDLVNAFIVELGINGGTQLASVSSSVNSLESVRVCNFIADADYAIQALHHNWKFHWRQFVGSLAAGGDRLATPSFFTVSGTSAPFVASQSNYQFRRIDRESLSFNYLDAQLANRPRWQDWRRFESLWQNRGAKSVSNSPPYFSQSPGGQLIVSTVMVDDTLYRYECWARPMRLVSDGDISPIVSTVALNDSGTNIIPPRLTDQPYRSTDGVLAVNSTLRTSTAPTQWDSARIIIVRAMIMYANVEGSTEIMQSALAEYEDLYDQLRADQLPGQESDRTSEADVPMTVETY